MSYDRESYLRKKRTHRFFTFTMDHSTFEEMIDASQADKISISAAINLAIEWWLENREHK